MRASVRRLGITHHWGIVGLPFLGRCSQRAAGDENFPHMYVHPALGVPQALRAPQVRAQETPSTSERERERGDGPFHV